MKSKIFKEASKYGDIVVLDTASFFAPLARNFTILSRRFCTFRLWHELPDGSYMILLAPSEHPCCPTFISPYSQMPAVRGEYFGAFVIRPVKFDSPELEECLVVHLCNTKLNAWLGEWDSNKSAQLAMVSALAGLSEACACEFI